MTTKTQPSGEIKKMFFAQYYGHEVLRWHQWTELTYYQKVDLSIPKIEGDGWYLTLKSLDNITDDDAGILQYTLINVIGLDGLIKESSSDLIKEVVSNYAQIDCLFMLPSSFTDKARELGYAIDWNGFKVQDLIDFGWIKLI
jgi:hypothetical protein